jgi:hypothetical protein
MYYIGRKLDVPKKLHDWANSFSLPYLSTHTDKVLPVDTITVGFEAWANRANNIYSWNKVIGSAKAKRRNQIARKTSSGPKTMSIALKTTDLFKQQLAFTTPPIPEELDDEPMDVEMSGVPGQILQTPIPKSHITPLPPVTKLHTQINNPPPKSHPLGHEEKNKELNSTTSSADGKMSALIPNSNIPIKDGTIRISLRWKTTADVVSLALSQQSQ